MWDIAAVDGDVFADAVERSTRRLPRCLIFGTHASPVRATSTPTTCTLIIEKNGSLELPHQRESLRTTDNDCSGFDAADEDVQRRPVRSLPVQSQRLFCHRPFVPGDVWIITTRCR